MYHRIRYPIPPQRGAALLAFILVLITSAAYMLLTKLNAVAPHYYTQQKQTLAALQHAKQALIGYALIYPEHNGYGPGYLPCPDRNGDGFAQTRCTANKHTTIGYFPFKTLETANLQDSSGATLWYAVADNYKNNPKLQPLNSETPGQFTLNEIKDDIVAVIIAPGAPIGDQKRMPDASMDEKIKNYLEQDNATDDIKYTRFFSINHSMHGESAAKNGNETNDYIVPITRTELMQAVEKRVLGEVNKTLAKYKKDYQGRRVYPWLAPFADPKTAARDSLYNGDAAGKLTNVLIDKDRKDQLLLQDSSMDFKKEHGGVRTVAAGDVLDIAENNALFIHAVSAQGLIVRLTDAMYKPQIGDDYRIRKNHGRAHAYARIDTGKKLHDPGARFGAKGIKEGDILIYSSTASADGAGATAIGGDFSIGTVHAVTEDSLTIDALHFSEKDQLKPGDYYSVLRFNAATNTYQGQLATHKTGAPFFSPFAISWEITTLHEADIIKPDEGQYERITAILTDALKTPQTPISVATGVCHWEQEKKVDCAGLSKLQTAKKTGTITAKLTDSTIVKDKTAAFRTDNIHPGDLIYNHDDGDTILYDEQVEAGSHSTASANSTALKLVDDKNNFIKLGVKPGDAIYNTSDGSSGAVAKVVDAHVLIAATLEGGVNNAFSAGDQYQVSEQGTARFFVKGEYVDFIAYDVKPYQYSVYNDKTGVRTLVSAVHNKHLLSTVPLSQGGQARFSPGDSFSIRRTATAVVDEIHDEHTLKTKAIDGVAVDFDCINYGADECNKGERYHIVVAAAAHDGKIATTTSCTTGTCIDDPDFNFIAAGIKVGDIVENQTAGTFWRIDRLTEHRIDINPHAAGPSAHFEPGDAYRIYYNYMHYSGYRLSIKYTGEAACPLDLSGQRIRAVCTKQKDAASEQDHCSSTACSAEIVDLKENEKTKIMIDVIGYAEDQKTKVAQLRFSATNNSKGTIETENIRYYTMLPDWFYNNDWHKLIYIAYDPHCRIDDAYCPLFRERKIPDQNDGILIAAGAATNTQNRAQGERGNYFESIKDPYEKEMQDNDQIVTISISD